MAETAADRFARDTGYETLTSIADHEDGDVRFARNYVSKDATMTVREYEDGAGTSALKTYIDGL